MKSQEYWRKRFIELENASNSYGVNTYRRIEESFRLAERDIQREIEAWYGRYALNNQVNMTEARRQLSTKELNEFKWDVKEYIKRGRENAVSGEWVKELENASSRVHINRLEALKIRTQQAAEVAFKNELDTIDSMARKVFTEDYYKSIFEVQKGFNMGWEVGQIDKRKLNTLISKPWASDGKNFSDRIWQQRAQLVDVLHKELTRTCLLGKAPDDAINTISKRFDVTKNQAGRLVMTEQAYFHSVAQKDAFKELDVEKYEIVATLDSHTSEICQEMDGKVFPMSEYEPGLTASPFHVWCRSVTVPYFDDNFTERAARRSDGKTYYVPGDMTYKEWSELYVNDANYGIYGKSSNAEQFDRYKAVLKELAPNSLDEFIKIKYNDKEKYETLKYQYRTVNRYEVDGDVPAETIIKLDNVACYTKRLGFDSDGLTDKASKKAAKKLRREGNAASMLFDDEVYFSHSRFGLDGCDELKLYTGEYPTVNLMSNRKFTVKPISQTDKIPRENDTEAKFLEFVATKKNPSDVFTVTILSEKHICPSCQGVVEQFKEMFPKSTVNIVSGKLGYNNSSEGTKTWKHRKKVTNNAKK